MQILLLENLILRIFRILLGNFPGIPGIYGVFPNFWKSFLRTHTRARPREKILVDNYLSICRYSTLVPVSSTS